ncbi:hypothetical protein HPP92_019377 [Vanilla planifolia]|uniref:Uncharacterized protein n=1 Tax=Vanilla planifolia TaxID=51239 RepID=A0A835Q6B7_VANPL|nr:hypothetical protein HPP92_019377 [Vanilla planifolia]
MPASLLLRFQPPSSATEETEEREPWRGAGGWCGPLTIPGVGPRNLRKLVDKGFSGVDKLKKLYKDKFFGKASQKMVEFLQSSVGIIHRNHAESITSFIKESVDEELKEDVDCEMKLTQKKRLTFCVEGNISVGKTTFLQKIANETIELRDLVEIVPEPISKNGRILALITSIFLTLSILSQRDMHTPSRTMFLLPGSCKKGNLLVVSSHLGLWKEVSSVIEWSSLELFMKLIG